MLFGILLAILTVLALAFAVPPLWLRTQEPLEPLEQLEQRKALNIAIYKERLAELEASGLMAKEFAQAKQELEKSLLSEIDTPQTQPFSSGARWSAVLVLLTVPLLAGALYWHTGAPQAALQNAPSVSAANVPHAGQGQAGNEMMPSLEEMVGKLEQRLESNPDDAQGWEMLGRSYVVMERYAEAMPAFAKAVALQAEPKAELLSSYAETIAMTKEGLLTGKPDELLAQALQADAQHPKTLWLVGLSAVQKGDYPTAVQHWEALLALLPPDSEGAQSVAGHIAELKRNRVDTTGAGATEAGAEPSAETATAEAAEQSATSAAATAQLTVSVSLDEKLQAQAAPNDTLFVYARAAQGPRMPLAIMRKQVKDLPVTVSLDDSMAMMPNMTLSSVPQVIAMARVSKSGSAMTQSGDLFGESAPLTLSETKTISVTINQQVP